MQKSLDFSCKATRPIIASPAKILAPNRGIAEIDKQQNKIMETPTEETKPQIEVKVESIEFTQEGNLVIFHVPVGHEILLGDQEFLGCCDYELAQGMVIVPTQSLQEMGYRFII